MLNFISSVASLKKEASASRGSDTFLRFSSNTSTFQFAQFLRFAGIGERKTDNRNAAREVQPVVGYFKL